MNIFTMLSSFRGSKKLTIGNVIKFSNYKSSVLHTELRVSTLVLFIFISTYPAVRVTFYAHVNMLGRNDFNNKLTYYLLAVTASLQLCEGKKPMHEQSELQLW